jgi:NADH-ubiquinone oxidoreductase complex I, 21 kDa subunit
MSTPFDGPVTGIPRYPVIDTDPHAFRVVRYFRSRDYATWGVVTAGFPASMYLWGALVFLCQRTVLTVNRSH